MPLKFIIVHGTGVREPAYSKMFNKIDKKLKEHNPDFETYRCYWGGSFGTTALADLQSLPQLAASKSLTGKLGQEEQVLELWRILYQDPLFELQALALQKGNRNEELVLSNNEPAEQLKLTFDTLLPLPEPVMQAFTEAGISETTLNSAHAVLIDDEDYQDALIHASSSLEDYYLPLARALVACSISLVQEQEGILAVSIDAKQRDHLVDLVYPNISKQASGQQKGIEQWFQEQFSGLLTRLGTPWIRDRRYALTENISAGGGDILKYQARSKELHDFILSILDSLSEPIVLLAHSLGGIACVDLLLLMPQIRKKVVLLVTVGSQAPALYEINALVGAEYNSNFRLPNDFPRWLNIYDQNDFLSYVGRDIFKGADGGEFVEDIEVQSNQPFPTSHGAYWEQAKVWTAIFDRLPAS